MEGTDMKSVVGIFTARAAAEQAVARLQELGIAPEYLNLLTQSSATKEQLHAVPTTDAEQPGIGPAIGGVVGGALGASGGLIGATIASAIIPGIGPVTAIGLAAIGLLGLTGGAVAGVVAGNALENALSQGLPKDELFVYEDALRQGRTVLIVLTEDPTQADVAREIMVQAGAESLDAARDNWWIGMRDVEEEVYTTQGWDFAQDEAIYRQGFEAALRWEVAGKPYDDVKDYLRMHYGDLYDQDAFRRGYSRGRAHAQGLRERYGKIRE
jgi:outer membrane lipoprotein SlyB